MPEALWAEAVEAARVVGVEATARALHLDRVRLAARMTMATLAADGDASGEVGGGFVEPHRTRVASPQSTMCHRAASCYSQWTMCAATLAASLDAPSAVVLTDWAAAADYPAPSARAFIDKVALLSLLYDEILIPDEALVLSSTLAGWYVKNDDFEALRRCFELGCVRILTHPRAAYPCPRLQELSDSHPFRARSEYLQEYSTKADQPFLPTEVVRLLHDRLDVALREYPDARRPVESGGLVDFRRAFAALLRGVLSHERYAQWIESAFGPISKNLSSTMLRAIEDPERAQGNLPEDSRRPGEVAFTRSLAYRLASRFPPEEKTAMQRLIQSAFAGPFAANFGAVGRYGPGLRELLVVDEGASDNDEEDGTNDELCMSVEAHIDVPFHLPILEANLKLVRDVRDSPQGRALRSAVREAGEVSVEAQSRAWLEHETGRGALIFEKQRTAWMEVADLFARVATRGPELTAKVALISYGKKLVPGAVVGGLWAVADGALRGLPLALAKVALGAAVGVGGHLLDMMRKQESIRVALEGAVEFRCVPLGMPTASLLDIA